MKNRFINNILVCFSIVFVVLRVLSINKYVNCISGYVIIFESIIGIALVFNKILKRDFCQTIPLSIISIILLLVLFGFIDLLKFGYIFIALLSITYFNYSLIKMTFNLKDLLKPGLLFFTIMFIGLFAADYFANLNVWDEYTFWSFYSKNMYLSDSINFSKLNITPLNSVSYPPIPTVMQYYFMKILGSYRQGYELFASQIIGFSLLLPLFKNTKKITERIVIAIVCLCIPAIFCDGNFYQTIYVDALLGLATGYAIYEYITNCNDNNKYANMIVILSVMFITLIKSSGFMFAFIIILFYVIYNFLNALYKNENKVIKSIKTVFKNKYLYIICFAFLVSFIGWGVYKQNVITITNEVLISGKSDKVNSFGSLFKSLIGSVTGYGYDIHSESISNTFANFIDKNYYSPKPFGMSVGAWLSIFLLSFVAIIYLLKNKEKEKKVVNIGISLFICFFTYLILLELAYLFKFSSYEAALHNSAQRYIGSMLIAIMFVIVGIVIKIIASKKDNKMLLIVLASVLIFTPVNIIAKGTILSGTRNYYNISYLRHEKNLANIVTSNVSSEDKLLTIDQGHATNHLLKVIYFAAPFKINNTIILTEEIYETIDFDRRLDETDYIVVVDVDDFIIGKIEEKYDVTLKGWSLYKKNNNTLELIDFVDRPEDE